MHFLQTNPAPPTADQVSQALAGVSAPEIHRPITDLGMVKKVAVAPDGTVRVEVWLTVAGCPMRDAITRSSPRNPGRRKGSHEAPPDMSGPHLRACSLARRDQRPLAWAAGAAKQYSTRRRRGYRNRSGPAALAVALFLVLDEAEG